MPKFEPNSIDTIQFAKQMFPDLKGSGENDDLFMHETSPSEVTQDISDFCEALGDELPVFVGVSAPPTARAGWCFANVAESVAKEGGRPVFGRALWYAPGLWINGEFHAVWQTADGRLRDVTPKPDGEECILFLPDPRFPATFNFYERPGNVRMRVYGHNDRRYAVAIKIAGFSEPRLSYETQKAVRKGVTLAQSVGAGMPGRDRLEKLIDAFLENVGVLETMLVPTPEGMVCKDPRREHEFHRRAHAVQRQKTKLFLMADLAVRGMIPGMSKV